MNKKFILAWVVVLAVWYVGSFIIHGQLLGADYDAIKGLYRPDEEAWGYLHLMVLSHVAMAGAFVWIYMRGTEDKPWVQQGLRYGVAVSLLTMIPWYTIYYVVQPLPGMFVIKQIVYSTILVLLLGLITAVLCREPSSR